MLPPRPIASLLLGMSCLQCLAQAPVAPAGKAAQVPTKAIVEEKSNEGNDAETILLAGLPNLKEKQAILSYARQTYIKADLIKDPVLLQMVRLALAKIEDQPEKAAFLRQEHLNKLADYFTKLAMEAQDAGRQADVLRFAQVAVRCNPANAKSKLFYANFLHSIQGRTDDAIQTLRHGLEFLAIDDPLTKDYLDRYFQLLQARERDQEVIDQGLKLLREQAAEPACPRIPLLGRCHFSLLDRALPRCGGHG